MFLLMTIGIICASDISNPAAYVFVEDSYKMFCHFSKTDHGAKVTTRFYGCRLTMKQDKWQLHVHNIEEAQGLSDLLRGEEEKTILPVYPLFKENKKFHDVECQQHHLCKSFMIDYQNSRYRIYSLQRHKYICQNGDMPFDDNILFVWSHSLSVPEKLFINQTLQSADDWGNKILACFDAQMKSKTLEALPVINNIPLINKLLVAPVENVITDQKNPDVYEKPTMDQTAIIDDNQKYTDKKEPQAYYLVENSFEVLSGIEGARQYGAGTLHIAEDGTATFKYSGMKNEPYHINIKHNTPIAVFPVFLKDQNTGGNFNKYLKKYMVVQNYGTFTLQSEDNLYKIYALEVPVKSQSDEAEKTILFIQSNEEYHANAFKRSDDYNDMKEMFLDAWNSQSVQSTVKMWSNPKWIPQPETVWEYVPPTQKKCRWYTIHKKKLLGSFLCIVLIALAYQLHKKNIFIPIIND